MGIVMFEQIIGLVVGLLTISEPTLVNGVTHYGGGNDKVLFHSNQGGIWLRPQSQWPVIQAPTFGPAPSHLPLQWGWASVPPQTLPYNPIYFLNLAMPFPRVPHFKLRPYPVQVPSPHYPPRFPSWHPQRPYPPRPGHPEKPPNKQVHLKKEGEDCGSCFCPPTFSAGECVKGLYCDMSRQNRIPDLPGICRPTGIS